MVSSSKFLFKIPGQTSWAGRECLDNKRIKPDTIVMVKDIGVSKNKRNHAYGECIGKIPYRDLKLKYSVGL